jgi:hypothetical protein
MVCAVNLQSKSVALWRSGIFWSNAQLMAQSMDIPVADSPDQYFIY